MSSYIFSILPLWLIYISTVLIIVLSIRGGIAYARWLKQRVKNEDDSSINTLVGATLGLLAFILAFTFSSSSSRFESRKLFLLEEVNSIETSWLRAGLLEYPYNNELQNALVDYAGIRVWLVKNPDNVKEALDNSQVTQNKIWNLITEMVQNNIGNDKINGLLIEAVNNMFDYQTRRVSKGIIDHIPNLIWIALFTLVIIAMFQVGYLLGKTERANWILVLALSMSFAVIVTVIVDLDSSQGHISINNKVLYDMYNRIKIN